MKRRPFESAALLLLFGLCSPQLVAAKELDQFSDRLRVLEFYAGGYRKIAGAPSPERVEGILDDKMNVLLDELATRLARDTSANEAGRIAHARKVFQHPLLAELVTPYEEWAKHTPELPLYRVRDKGIYGYAVNYDDMRMTWYIELSPIIQVHGTLIGLDKLGHFLAQGFQYFEYFNSLDKNLLVSERAQLLREFGHKQEVGQLGLATGGIYSLADLASNWSGMLFFLSLFDDVRVEAEQHARFFAPDSSGVFRRVRDFHWAEWVSSDWDEALNPAHAEKRLLFDKVVQNFWRPSGAPGSTAPSVCAEYRRDPAAFLGPIQPRTRSRYALPERVEAAAPFPIDVKRICHAFGPNDVREQWKERLPLGAAHSVDTPADSEPPLGAAPSDSSERKSPLGAAHVVDAYEDTKPPLEAAPGKSEARESPLTVAPGQSEARESPLTAAPSANRTDASDSRLARPIGAAHAQELDESGQGRAKPAGSADEGDHAPR